MLEILERREIQYLNRAKKKQGQFQMFSFIHLKVSQLIRLNAIVNVSLQLWRQTINMVKMTNIST